MAPWVGLPHGGRAGHARARRMAGETPAKQPKSRNRSAGVSDAWAPPVVYMVIPSGLETAGVRSSQLHPYRRAANIRCASSAADRGSCSRRVSSWDIHTAGLPPDCSLLAFVPRTYTYLGLAVFRRRHHGLQLLHRAPAVVQPSRGRQPAHLCTLGTRHGGGAEHSESHLLRSFSVV